MQVTMDGMPKERSAREGRACLAVVCLLLGFGVACGRQDIDSRIPASQQALPFHPDSQDSALSAAAPSVPPDGHEGNAEPFRPRSQMDTIPEGTLVTVRLQASLSARNIHAGDSFSAVLAFPLSGRGSTVVPAGTMILGRVESVRVKQETGSNPRCYFRLKLESANLQGKQESIRTSSLFASATHGSRKLRANADSGIQKGRELTFRLTAPLALNSSMALAAQPGLAPPRISPHSAE